MSNRDITKFAFVGVFDRFSVGDEGVLLRSFQNEWRYDRTMVLDDEFARDVSLRYPTGKGHKRIERVRKRSMLGDTSLVGKEELMVYVGANSEDTAIVISAYEDAITRASLINLLKPSGIIVRISSGDEETKRRYRQAQELTAIEKEKMRRTRSDKEKIGGG